MNQQQSQPQRQPKRRRKPADKPARQFLPIPELTEAEQARFDRLIDRTPGLGPQGTCHEWRGSTTGEGYPSFALRGKTFHAHRVALRIALCADFPDKLACHRCDHPRCVRAAHLFAGSARENLDDARQKGRWKPPTKAASIDGQANRTNPNAPDSRPARTNHQSGPIGRDPNRG